MGFRGVSLIKERKQKFSKEVTFYLRCEGGEEARDIQNFAARRQYVYQCPRWEREIGGKKPPAAGADKKTNAWF